VGFTYDQEGRVEQLVAFCEALGLQSPCLFGNSLGGLVSLGGCIARPDLFDKVVVMGACARLTEASENVRKGYTFLPNREQMRMVLNTLTRPGYEIDEKTLDYRYMIACDPRNEAAHLAIGGWILQQLDNHQFFGYTEQEIRSIPQEVLVIHGWGDQVVPVGKGYELAGELKSGWFHAIPSCGHWAMLEHPGEFEATVRYFLERD
jgi:2-hydroxy-6-oxo-6-(2'-aminophenyl)hexa-2,4-dienoate hydrolase